MVVDFWKKDVCRNKNWRYFNSKRNKRVREIREINDLMIRLNNIIMVWEKIIVFIWIL